MTPPPRQVIILPVDDPTRLTIELEIQQTAIRGAAHDIRGRSVPFTGWLGLIGAITELQAPADGAADPVVTVDPAEPPAQRARRSDRVERA